MDSKAADLSSLRINRDAPPAPAGGGPRWVLIGIPIVLLLLLAGFLVAKGFGGGVPVHLTPAVRVSPSQANVLASASGYVVAQRKAAVASKATGRLVYLGVVEGDRVKEGQVIARIEDGDVRAQLAQAEANLALETPTCTTRRRRLTGKKRCSPRTSPPRPTMTPPRRGSSG